MRNMTLRNMVTGCCWGDHFSGSFFESELYESRPRQVTDLEPEICAALRESLQETRRCCVEIRASLGLEKQ